MAELYSFSDFITICYISNFLNFCIDELVLCKTKASLLEKAERMF